MRDTKLEAETPQAVGLGHEHTRTVHHEMGQEKRRTLGEMSSQDRVELSGESVGPQPPTSHPTAR
jgi:hypothetical protein